MARDRKRKIRPLRRAASWVAASPADRGAVPLAIAAGLSAPLLHMTGVPTADVALAAAGVLPGITGGGILAATRSGPTAAKAAAGTILTGTWLAAASRWGVLSGPDHLTAILGATGAITGYAVMRGDEHLRERRRQHAQRSVWRQAAAELGLAGSHLVRHTRTRLGERLELDVRGTGQRASRLANADVAERFAEQRGLPAGRVTVTPGRIAGRIEVSIRDRNPWEQPTLHPLLDPEPEITLPEAATIRQPLIIGQDPETGKPFDVTLWSADAGAHSMLIVAQRGGGKTVLLNNLTERATACADVVVWSINISKAQEDRAWAPAFGLGAAGPADRVRALWILRMARAAIDYRGNIRRSTAVFQPQPGAPFILLRIDEMHALFRYEDEISREMREHMAYIAATNRSEAVGLMGASQRGTAAQTGGADVRANFDLFGLMKMRGMGEMQHAAGDVGLMLPDIARYGEGYPGVTLVTGLAGDYTLGRTFLLHEISDIERIASSRVPGDIEPGLAESLGDAYQMLLAGETPPADWNAGGDSAWLGAVDREVTAGMDPDLKARLARLGERNRQAREILGADVPAQRDQADISAQLEDAARQVDLPEQARGALLLLLRQPNGVSVRRAADALEVSADRAHKWLTRLRLEGLADVRGSGRGAAFYATPRRPDGPAELSSAQTIPAPPCAREQTYDGQTFGEGAQ